MRLKAAEYHIDFLRKQLEAAQMKLEATLAHFDNAFCCEMHSMLGLIERDHTLKMENRRLQTESDELKSEIAELRKRFAESIEARTK